MHAGQAGGFVMAGISRRTALGLLAGAAVPSASVVAAAPASEIDGLIAECNRVRTLAFEADKIWLAIWDDPARPQEAYLDAAEFRPIHWPLPRKTYYDIDFEAPIDKYEHQLAWQWDTVIAGRDSPDDASLTTWKQRHAERLAASRREREKLRTLLSQRKVEHERWRALSGYRAAVNEADELWDRKIALENQILSFECKTLAEFKAKARYIVEEFEGEYSEESANRFIAELATT
jgi:hypothetical protein